MINKKTASGVADRKRSDQTGQAIPKSSQLNSITKKNHLQVSDLLQHGAKNAISSKVLMELLNLPSQRELRSLVSRARGNGEIILSNRKGYFLPAPGEDGLQEIRECVRTLRAKGISTLRSASALKKPLKELYGQEFIDELELD